MALMGDSEGLHRTVRGLQRLGVEVAIDNFGSGYSSLGLVRGFSVTAVKIDKTLVSSCINKRECAAIVEAVGAMAKTLGITVIAAGVETEEEKRLVHSLGCERAQGMLVGRPVGWSEIREAKRSPSLLPQ
jgi:EAL domain-containing protein (putative c-di-GMP-specific phosphodiesterase class I)